MSEIRLVGNRTTGEIVTENVLGAGLLSLAYESAMGPVLRALLLHTGWASRLLGWYCDTAWSRRRIDGVVEELGIDMEDFETPVGGFRTFNQWFVRKLKPGVRPYDPDPAVFCSPADCRLSVIPRIEKTTAIPVKGTPFSIGRLIAGNDEDAGRFDGGVACVFRLCPSDYHRYHFPADGRVVDRREVTGRYHSVNPVALAAGIPVFTENRRVVTLLEFNVFGPAVFVEVGAFGVGGIVETHGDGPFAKMDEKGYFRYGASTLVVVVGPGRLQIDEDILSASGDGMETLVAAGETIGHRPTE